MRQAAEPSSLQRWLAGIVIAFFVVSVILLTMYRLSDATERQTPALTIVVAMLGIGYLARAWTDLRSGWSLDLRARWRSRQSDFPDYCMATGCNWFFAAACLGILIDWHG